MDYFDFKTISTFITKNKQNVESRLKDLQFTERTLQNSSDLLCQVLEYSPKLTSDPIPKQKLRLKATPSLYDLLPKEENNIEIVEEPQENTTEKIVRQILNEIINKITMENVPSKSNNNEDSDDEYERALARRQQEIEKRQNQSSRHENNNSHAKNSVSKISNLFNESTKVRVYIMNTHTFIDIDITSNDTISSLKKEVIEHLIQNHNKYNITLQYKQQEAYEIRLVDDDEDVPNMDFGALDDDINIVQSKSNKFAFVEKPNYKPGPDKNMLLGEQKQGEKRVNIKIYIKNDSMTSSSKIISMKGEDTLKDVLLWLLNRDLLKYKNIDLYYFVEHSETVKKDDIDNALNLDITMNLLPCLELDLNFKKLPDVPEAGNDSNTKDNDSSDEKVFIFNEISAGKKQEFEVVKINKFNSKQERVLGIDMYYLYNEKPKNKQGNLFNKFFGEKTKKPMRKIKDIKRIGPIDKKGFFIEMKKNENEEEKKMRFEVKDVNVRNEILAKLNYLINFNQESK